MNIHPLIHGKVDSEKMNEITKSAYFNGSQD